MGLREAKMNKCMKAGHDWAYNVDLKGECMTAICLRCGAKQCYFIDYVGEVSNDPNMDDDRSKE